METTKPNIRGNQTRIKTTHTTILLIHAAINGNQPRSATTYTSIIHVHMVTIYFDGYFIQDSDDD